MTQWNFFAFSSDGQGKIIVRLNKSGKTNDTVVCNIATDNPLVVGATSQLKHNFKGVIDDIRIYDCALTVAQLNALCDEQGGVPGTLA